MPCPHCKAEVAPTDVYCISCGARLLPVAPQAETPRIDQAETVLRPDGVNVLEADTVVPPQSSIPSTRHDNDGAAAGETSRKGVRTRSRRRWHFLLITLLINAILLAASAWLVYAALVRYAARNQPALRLGSPRLVRVAPRPVAVPEARTAQREPPPTPTGTPTPPTPAKGSAGGRPATEHGSKGSASHPPAGHGSGPASRPPKASRPPRAGSGSSRGGDSAEQVRAGLDAESVRQVVQHYLPQIRGCVDRALKQQDRIAGVVEIQFEVGSAGRVRTSSVYRNTTGHEGLGKCIATTLRSWRFPRPVGGDVIFVYPFLFSPGE